MQLWLHIMMKNGAFLFMMTILCRVAFMGFDPAIVSKFDEKKITILIAKPRIRIPEAKIRGAIEIQFRRE
ncbi:hypothetical protein BDL97_13G051600 [Sphagnum fallax]|nr:hypothetical protein BDL97_13G051600 [Sphagnum fallax]